jgi:hypothetical protein
MSDEKQLDLTDVFAKLSAPFPLEAQETDSSRGFVMTGIKGAYVIERLNQVLGLCGTGWSFSVTGMEVTEKFVLADIELQYCVNGEWSKPIPISGDQMIVRERVGDAKKGAITDALKKAAGMLGVGNEAYKGLLTPSTNGKPARQPRKETSKPAPARAPAKRRPKATPKPPAPAHWIDDNTTRRKFWAWCKTELGLDEDTVHSMLKVKHIRDYTGTKTDAFALIEALLAEAAEEAAAMGKAGEGTMEY